MSSFSQVENSSFTQGASLRDSTYVANNSEPLNFFDIDDILASQSRVPCTFNVTAYRLGYINPKSEAEHIETGSELELPLWLGRSLAGRKNIVKVDVPQQYGTDARIQLQADANIVNLNTLGPYYYESGIKFLGLETPDSEPISEVLIKTFSSRSRHIMDISHNTYEKDQLQVTHKLDQSERKLFMCGKSSIDSFHQWETQKCKKLSSSGFVRMKRKRPADDL